MIDYQQQAEELVQATQDMTDVAHARDYPLGETWAITVSQNRDSDALERSNFQIISDDMEKRFPQRTAIVRYNHWAVGWIDHLIVQMLTKQGKVTRAGMAIIDWRDKLEDYPVADETAYSALEYETVIETLQNVYNLSEDQAGRVHSLMRDPREDSNDADVQQAIAAMYVEDMTALGMTRPVFDRALKWMNDEPRAREEIISMLRDARDLPQPLLAATLDWAEASGKADPADVGNVFVLLGKLLEVYSVRDVVRIVLQATHDQAPQLAVDNLEQYIATLDIQPEDKVTLPLFGRRR